MNYWVLIGYYPITGKSYIYYIKAKTIKQAQARAQDTEDSWHLSTARKIVWLAGIEVNEKTKVYKLDGNTKRRRSKPVKRSREERRIEL